MELILANDTLNDIRRVFDYEIDVDLTNTNTFEFKVQRSDYAADLTFGNAVYAAGTEYGGIIGQINTQTSLDTISLKGYTWRGMLGKKIIKPPAGEDHLVVSGELNTIIKTLITEQFSSVFVVSAENSGSTVTNFQFDRYCTMLAGIKKMLGSVGYKLKIEYVQQEHGTGGYVQLSAAPIEDYSSTIELSQDSQLDFGFENVRNGVNHLICLGKGEGTERTVIDLYVQEDGSIGTTPYFTGTSEIAEAYEDTSAEDAASLKEKGTEKLQELMNYTTFEMNVETLDIDVDIGDIIGGRDYDTGLYAKKPVTGKIWRVSEGVEAVEYSVSGEGEESEDMD